jgi:tRNA uridine 5-carboxymethylaminomethyl modification enzyme
LDGKTIAWDGLDVQPGDDDPVMLSFLNKAPKVRQVACGITHTNERTHDIVRANLDRSAMYGGHIEGVGPRYCPSIEDKVVRFADKTGHQIFLEPEGLDDDTVYPNGISTSLPADVQHDYVRSIKGLEDVVILQPGYAIEYDFFDPSALRPTLESTAKNLYFAGQINGTTGYEEAAAQGLVAGANAAAAALGRPPVLFSRTDSYIGVMLDDLISRGVTEPYRMFTSRAEYRLHLRADNADQRMTGLGLTAGLIGPSRADAYAKKMARIGAANAVLGARSCSPQELQAVGIGVSRDGAARNLLQVLAFAETQWSQIDQLLPEMTEVDAETKAQVWRDALYAQYLHRERADADTLRRNEQQRIPAELDFNNLPGLSNELASKLLRRRPTNLAEAERIEGMTPAALLLLLAHCRKANALRAVGL